jgi:hypothetical protein
MSRTKIIIGTTAVILAVIGYGIFQTLTTLDYGLLKLTVSPTDASIKIDGKGSAKAGDISLPPGEHTIEVSRKGYATKTINVKIISGIAVEEGIALTITDPKLAAEQEELSEKEVAEREGAVGKIAAEQGAKITAANPLIKKLPYYGPDFNIDTGKSRKYPNDSTAVGIYITVMDEAGKKHAFDWIRAQGFNPEAYEIIYDSGHEGEDAHEGEGE